MYLIDSNFFIQASRVNYPFDIVPGFWKKVKELSLTGKIRSLDKVKNELYQNNDDLHAWCESNLAKSFFCDSADTLSEYSQVINWIESMNHQYNPKAIQEFMDYDEADAWLISYALKHNLILVTHEVSQPQSKSKVKIPDVCIKFNIQYTNTIEMFRRLKETF